MEIALGQDRRAGFGTASGEGGSLEREMHFGEGRRKLFWLNSLMRYGHKRLHRDPSTPARSLRSLAVGQDDRGKSAILARPSMAALHQESQTDPTPGAAA